MTNTTTFAAAARQAKATKMASALLDQAPASYWLSSESTHPAPADFILTVAKAAGVASAIKGRTPSAATWSLVLDQLRADALFAANVAS